MSQDAEARDGASNACCAALQKMHSKLLEKYSKVEEMKNKFRHCATMVQNKYDALEKNHESLRKEIKEQANVWKNEKDNETGRRIDLEDEVSALQDEVRLLKQNGSSASERADERLQERIVQAEEEIKQLKELLDQERGEAALAKKNAEVEKKKADESLKKLEKASNKVSEAQKAVNAERKKAEDNRLRWENFKKEADDMKSMLALEKSKSEAAEKKVEAEKQKAIRERKKAGEQQKFAETSLKKANLEKDRADDLNRKLEHTRNRVEQLEGELLKHNSSPKLDDRLLLEKSKKEIDDLKSLLGLEKSKSEAAHKKVGVEKHKAIGERKRAYLAVVKSKEQMELAETNLKKALFEKDRADALNRKLEEARNRAEKLELVLRKHISSVMSVEVQADRSNTVRNALTATDVNVAMLMDDTPLSQWVEKMLLEKEQNDIKEKKHADSEKKKAKKQKEAAEHHKKMAMEHKHSADQLSEQLQKYKLRVEKLQKELQESVSCRIYANNSPSKNNIIFETDTVKLLKKQLKLEKLLAKHAKEATKVEAFRNKILQQELCHLKQEFLQFQQRLNILDKSFLHGSEGIDQLGKNGGQTSKSQILVSDGHHRRLLSGIDSRRDPPYRGSNQKMLQSYAINSSSASFSDRPLVGSQERGTLSIMTSANLGEDNSNFKPKMPDKTHVRYNKHDLAKDDNRTSSPIKVSSGKRILGSCEKKRSFGAGDSIENLYAEGENMHQQVSKRLSLLHDILKGQMDEPEKESLRETTCGKLFRPLKKRRTSEGTVIIHHLQDSVESNGMLDSDIINSDTCMPASSPGSDAMRSDCGFEDGKIINLVTPNFDHLVTDDYMKLLDMDNAAIEDSYRRAIASPLSPILSEVAFHEDERLEVGSSEIRVNKSFQKGLSNASDHPVMIEMEKNIANAVSNSSVPSQLLIEHNSVDSKDTLPEASEAHHQETHVSSEKLGMSYLSNSGNRGTVKSCQNEIAYRHDGIQKYFVVASDNQDDSSILRILQTICSCMLDHSVEIFIQNTIHTLSKAEDLSTREKASVFFSLILHEISELGLKNLENGLGDNLVHSLGSVSMKVIAAHGILTFHAALSDPALKRMFIESCDLFELLALIEDFLLQRKVLVYDGSVSAESKSHFTSKLNLILNGNPIMLLEVSASAHLVVAGGSLLASLCSAVDHIGFVCEMSCNIIRMQKLDPPVMLAILHVFAHICGSKYFTLQQYSIAMTLVKSLVMFLEKHTLRGNSTSYSLSDFGKPSNIFSCTNCPFSAGAVSVEDVAVVLLENLQKQCHSGSWLQDSLALVNLLIPRLQPREEGHAEVSGLGEADLLSSLCNANLRDFLDILSLVEVLASVMCWNWTSDHLVGGVCEYLELNLMEGVPAAAIILLGQLGRIGVDACGYEDSGVKKLRGCLSRFACATTFKKLSLPVQFAVITSLFDLIPIKFEEIVEGKIEIPAAAMGRSIPASFIREWFFGLNHEQQSFLRLHLHVAAANEGN